MFDIFYSPLESNMFFLIFIGIPLVFFGPTFLMYGYIGAIARFQTSEILPIAKDSSNYMIKGTKDSVVDLVSDVLEPKIKCPKCGELNEKDAKFCDNCGVALEKICLSCKAKNDIDAKFCK